MKEIIKSEYSKFFFAGLIFNLLCAWFSLGYNHPDEHFQVLEFCNYKLGFSPATALPWEFKNRMRPSLLPYFMYVLARFFQWMGAYNPFTIGFILRLITGIASWFITCRLCVILFKNFKTKEAQKLLVLMSLFLWFMPYLDVRYSSENISGLLLLYGVYLLLINKEKGRESILAYLMVGFLFGVSFFIRIQAGFALGGLAAWLIFVEKTKWKYLFIMALSAIIAIGLNILLDSKFYGELTFTPYNYYFQNITLHKAEGYGSYPWWWYLLEFTIRVIPPLSLVLLVMFFAGVYKNPRSIMVWIIVPIIVLHSVIAHKEMRFLFPVTFVFFYLTALGFDYFFTKPSYIKIHKYIYIISLIIIIPAFLYRTFTPAALAVKYDEYLYYHITKKNTIMFSLRSEPDYEMADLIDNYYRNPNINSVLLDSIGQINSYMLNNHTDTAYYMNKKNLKFDYQVPGYKKEMLFTYIPSFVLKFNINDWESRAQIWSIYRFTKETGKN
jgi:phosphatidylinositol glycan class B